MITYVKGNIFESPAHVLVNTINVVGVMGKGIANTFKKIYPDMFKKYQQLCEEGKIDIGKLWLYKTDHKWILHFPTKKHWKSPSKVEYLELGLKSFVDNYSNLGITSIAFPPLGCGNGELNWEKQVRPIMERYLKNLPIDIFIYLYDKGQDNVPEHKNIKEIKEWLRSEPRSLGFSEVWEDLKQIIGNEPSITTRIARINITCGISKLDDQLENEAIKIFGENGNLIISISYEEWMTVWSIVRNYGFITNKILPYDLNNNYDEIITLLLKLPYCREVIINKNYLEINSGTIGLQLNEMNVPAAKPQLELQF